MKAGKKLTNLLLALCVTVSTFGINGVRVNAANYWPEGPETTSPCVIVLEEETGTVLYEKNADEQHYPASITKIMTALLAIENSSMDEEVTFSEDAVYKTDGSSIWRDIGEKMTMEECLYALMLNSDNDAAVMIAEQVGGSVEGFAEKMNLKARELGCDDTYFITPNGLDAENKNGIHSTTAKDLARILRYCIMESPKKAEFLAITQMPAYTFWNYSKTQIYQCTNHNAFLGMMDGALTGKTGFTGNAGYCYVGALQWEGKTLIVSLLACGWPNNRGYKWEDTRKLMTYGLTNYEYRDVFEQKDLGRIAVLNGRQQGTTIDEVATTSLEYGSDVEQMHLSLLLRKDEQITVHYQLPPQLEAPVRKGQQIGVAQYFLGKELLQEYPIYAGEQVDVRDYYWCLEQIGAAYCA